MQVLVWGTEPWRHEDLRIRLGYLPERPIYPLDAVVEDLLFHLAIKESQLILVVSLDFKIEYHYACAD
jgi:hypothetical protein